MVQGQTPFMRFKRLRKYFHLHESFNTINSIALIKQTQGEVKNLST